MKDSETYYQLREMGIMLIGRDPRCDLVFDFPNISRKHCQLMVSTIGLFVEVTDLDSSNGILVNGKLAKKAILYPGDTLQVGNIFFELEDLEKPPENFIPYQPKKLSELSQIPSDNEISEQKVNNEKAVQQEAINQIATAEPIAAEPKPNFEQPLPVEPVASTPLPVNNLPDEARPVTKQQEYMIHKKSSDDHARVSKAPKLKKKSSQKLTPIAEPNAADIPILGEDAQPVQADNGISSQVLPHLDLEQFYSEQHDKFDAIKKTQNLARENIEVEIDPMIGKTIDNYQLEELLDITFYWKEYKAKHILFETPCIVRLISEQQTKSPGFEHRFRRETKVSLRLSHKNIISLKSAGKFAEHYFFVRDYQETSRLDILVSKKGKLKPKAAIYVGTQLASALLYAHQKKVIHRNINPTNIMLDKAGTAYLSDFGFAAILEEPSTGATTTEGVDPRSLPYRAPELLGEKPYANDQSDVYSLCAVLYFAIAGFSPFQNIFEALRLTPPPLDQLVKNIDPRLSEIIAKGLNKNYLERFDNTQTFYDAFKALNQQKP